MTSEPLLLDPEVEGLLREVAADPHSSLLRVPRERAVPTLYEDRPAAGPATAGLSAAEREILRVHRFEVAWLIKKVCLLKLVSGPNTHRFVSSHLTAHNQIDILDSPNLARESHSLSHNAPSDHESKSELALLEQAVANPIAELPTVVELATAAHRLQPAHDWRILASQDLALRASPRTAFSLLEKVLVSYPSNRHRVSAWSALGLVHSSLGALAQAHLAYRRACDADNEFLTPWMDRFALALQAGEYTDAIHAGDYLDRAIDPHHPLVLWYVTTRLDRRRTGEWSPSTKARLLIPRIADKCGLIGGRISHVFS